MRTTPGRRGSPLVDLGKADCGPSPFTPVQESRGMTLDNLGRNARNAKPILAREDLDKAIDFQLPALRSSPRNPDYLDRLGGHYCTRAGILPRLGKYAEAAEDVDKYRGLCPDDVKRLGTAAGVLAHCAARQIRTGAGRAAQQELAQAYGGRAVELLPDPVEEEQEGGSVP